MPTTLRLIDRSRIVDGRGTCMMSRGLGYHAGPTGYGLQLKATKLPLMTGIIAHDGLAHVLTWCVTHDEEIRQAFTVPLGAGEILLPVPRVVVREAVQLAQQKYWNVVKLRGFAYLEEDESVQYIIREQNYLIEGLIWAWCLEVLPEVLRRGRILEAEYDDSYVIGCTCGLGDGILTKADHEARDCEGLGFMQRPDFLLLTWTGELEYHEFKTTGMDSSTFRDKWEVMVQMFAGILDAERRHEKHVQSIYVHGLIKGKRQQEYNALTRKYDAGMYLQQSPFCYGFRKAANPPMEPEDWKPSYEYWDDFEQKTKRLPRAYTKTGVWEILPGVEDGDLLEATGCATRGEYWVTQALTPEVRRKQLVLLGPFSRQDQMVAGFLDETLGEEARIQEGVWQLYELAQELETGYTTPDYWAHVWPDERFQRLLARVFPRSYECRRYGKRNRCQFERICFRHEGWADPIGAGLYIPRRPHHKDELDQAVARGLMVPDEGLGEDVEQELP